MTYFPHKTDHAIRLQRRMRGIHLCKWIGVAILLLCGFNQEHTSVQAGDNGVTDLVPLVGIRQISAQNSYHTCAVTTDGGVKCWGANFYHQLGDGTTVSRSTPVDVIGLSSGVIAVVTGEYHTCALTAVGGVKCWGGDDGSEPGNRMGIGSDRPVDIAGLSANVVALAAGTNHTCALLVDGAVKCWGKNTFGQLGDGTQVDRAEPVAVDGLPTDVIAISAGFHHTCAQTRAGVMCWGWNAFGQLGDGSTDDSAQPVNITGLASDVAAITSGAAHTCALMAEGGIKCWGLNSFGQLGDGTVTNRTIPTTVLELMDRADAISAGGNHTCTIMNSIRVACWGNNGAGQLGDGTEQQHSLPTEVLGLPSAVKGLITGGYHTCVLTMVSGIFCWGYNLHGQLGDGTKTDSPYPLQVKTEIVWTDRLLLPIISR